MFLFEANRYGVASVGVSVGNCVGVSVGITGAGTVSVGGGLVDVAVGGNSVTVGVMVGNGVAVGTLSVIVTLRSA